MRQPQEFKVIWDIFQDPKFQDKYQAHLSSLPHIKTPRQITIPGFTLEKEAKFREELREIEVATKVMLSDPVWKNEINSANLNRYSIHEILSSIIILEDTLKDYTAEYNRGKDFQEKRRLEAEKSAASSIRYLPVVFRYSVSSPLSEQETSGEGVVILNEFEYDEMGGVYDVNEYFENFKDVDSGVPSKEFIDTFNEDTFGSPKFVGEAILHLLEVNWREGVERRTLPRLVGKKKDLGELEEIYDNIEVYVYSKGPKGGYTVKGAESFLSWRDVEEFFSHYGE